MKTIKSKSITELRNSLFETFDAVVAGEIHHITHKNGRRAAIVPIDTIQTMQEEIELHKNLAIGYAQALRGEGVSSSQLKENLKAKEAELRLKYS